MFPDKTVIERNAAIVKVFDHGISLGTVRLNQVAMFDNVAASTRLTPDSIARRSWPDQFLTSIR